MNTKGNKKLPFPLPGKYLLISNISLLNNFNSPVVTYHAPITLHKQLNINALGEYLHIADGLGRRNFPHENPFRRLGGISAHYVYCTRRITG